MIGGHVMAHSDSTTWAPQVEAGRLRLLATYGSKRTKRWPDVPTLEDLGYKTVSGLAVRRLRAEGDGPRCRQDPA